MNKYSLYILVFLSTSFVVQAQSRKKLEEKYWQATAEEIISIPTKESWKDNAGIVLLNDQHVRYVNRRFYSFERIITHKIIKIQDKTALEVFTTLTLPKDQKLGWSSRHTTGVETILGVRIIKPDGSIVTLDIEEEQIIEDDTIKVAIPNLNVGDIIDYYLLTETETLYSYGYHAYPPVEKTLTSNYPTSRYVLLMEVENDYMLNMNTYNGAPVIKEVETERGATKGYLIKQDNLEQYSTDRWTYPLVEQPCVKWQVVFAKTRSIEKSYKFFGGEDKEIKSKVTRQEVLENLQKLEWKWPYRKGPTKKSKKFIENNPDLSKGELINLFYEKMRFNFYTSQLEKLVAAQEEIITGYDVGTIYETDRATNELRILCELLDVDYEIVFAQPRYDGKMDDLLIRKNVRLGIKVLLDEPIYFFEFDSFSSVNSNISNIEGAEAYTATLDKKYKIPSLKDDIIPVSSPSDNKNIEVIDLTFDADFKNVNFKRNTFFTGYFILEDYYKKATWMDVYDEDMERFRSEGQETWYEEKRKKERLRLTAAIKGLRESGLKNYRDRKEESAESEWETEVDNYAIETVNTGRYNGDALQIMETFTMENKYLKKAGPNYIFEIGKFIGGQIRIEDDERQRDVDINIDFPKTFGYKITVTIPDGYTVAGMEKLNKNIKNSTGSFISSARMEGNQLILDTDKVYAKNNYDPSAWPEMLLWLDAASDFTQSKILLKKD